jgi:hypothetical protein
MTFRKSVNKPNHGPTIEWHGGACPVAAGTPVSFLRRGDHNSWRPYWLAVRKPELLDWRHTGGPKDIVAYYERVSPLPLPVFGEARAVAPAGSDDLERERAFWRGYEAGSEAMKGVLVTVLERFTASAKPE